MAGSCTTASSGVTAALGKAATGTGVKTLMQSCTSSTIVWAE
jgi:hypothetical protein